MANKSISRRDILKSAALGVPAGPVLRLIRLETALHLHTVIVEEKKEAPRSEYTPKFFKPDEYETLRALCQAIIPPDDRSGGAIEAGAPEFIDLLTSENEEYQRRLGGGLMWLDATCLKRYGKTYFQAQAYEQKEILDLIAYRANGDKDSSLATGVSFFAFLRDLTVDGYFTSEIGIKNLRYIGNAFLAEFPGCPPVPGL
jgi:gluconate 2-dehydrogenase subunit 3-like protein